MNIIRAHASVQYFVYLVAVEIFTILPDGTIYQTENIFATIVLNCSTDRKSLLTELIQFLFFTTDLQISTS